MFIDRQMNKKNPGYMHNWILFCYKEKQNNERRLMNPEITDGPRRITLSQ